MVESGVLFLHKSRKGLEGGKKNVRKRESKAGEENLSFPSI